MVLFLVSLIIIPTCLPLAWFSLRAIFKLPGWANVGLRWQLISLMCGGVLSAVPLSMAFFIYTINPIAMFMILIVGIIIGGILK